MMTERRKINMKATKEILKIMIILTTMIKKIMMKPVAIIIFIHIFL